MGEPLAYRPTNGCPSSCDRLSVALRAVVHRLTSGCPSPYEQLSIAIRAIVRCLALSYEQLDNILVAIIFEGNDVKSCWDACWHYK